MVYPPYGEPVVKRGPEGRLERSVSGERVAGSKGWRPAGRACDVETTEARVRTPPFGRRCREWYGFQGNSAHGSKADAMNGMRRKGRVRFPLALAPVSQTATASRAASERVGGMAAS